MAKSPFTVGDQCSYRDTHCPYRHVKPYAHMDETLKLEPLAKTWLVALEYLPLRVGALVTCLEISDEKKKTYEMVLCIYHSLLSLII